MRCGRLVFVSGQLPAIGPSGATGTFEDQTREVLKRMLTISREAGGDPESIAKVSAYLVGIENWPTFNRIYAELMGAARPARCVIPVPALHYGALIEVEAIVMLGDDT
jgi:enamine deaminase RidA (YjgF/YER057c/UK114 family)